LFNIDSLLNKVNLPLGEETYREPLSILLKDYENHSNLTRLGSLSVQRGIVKTLESRGRLFQFINNNNLAEPSTPIIVSGLPRSGTTYLLDLLHCSDELRGPLTWEIFQMMPLATSPYQQAYKKIKTEAELALLKTLVPKLKNIHPMKAVLPEECQLITALDFRSISFSYSSRVPEYASFINNCDYSSALLWHKRFLQALETTSKPNYWLLKDPCHIQHISEILNTYPEAKFVFIHRHPKDTIASISSLSAHLRSAFSKSIDKHEIGQGALSFWAKAIENFLDQRTLINESNMIDINFNEFINNPFGLTETIFKKFKLNLDAHTRAKIEAFINKSQLRKSSHHYNLDDFALTTDQVNQSFKSYIETFSL
tara:strand:- start:2002 stop:3108 length:1107 start_codon:yes stop_codon:yes gene_type:complete